MLRSQPDWYRTKPYRLGRPQTPPIRFVASGSRLGVSRSSSKTGLRSLGPVWSVNSDFGRIRVVSRNGEKPPWRSQSTRPSWDCQGWWFWGSTSGAAVRPGSPMSRVWEWLPVVVRSGRRVRLVRPRDSDPFTVRWFLRFFSWPVRSSRGEEQAASSHKLGIGRCSATNRLDDSGPASAKSPLCLFR